MIDNLGTLGKSLPKLGPGKDNAVFLGVGAGPQGGHAVALMAVEGPVNLKRPALQVFGGITSAGNAIENLLGLEQAVEVTYAGMVTTDDHLGDTVVLAEGGMQQGLTGTCIAHIQGVAGLDDVVLHEVVLDQAVDGLYPNVGGNVALLEVTDQGVDQHAIAHLDGDLGQELMGAVHGITQLQGSDVGPTALLEHGAGFGRGQVDTLVLDGILTLGKNLDRASQVDFLLVHDHLNAGMILQGDFPELVIGGLFALAFENLLALSVTFMVA